MTGTIPKRSSALLVAFAVIALAIVGFARPASAAGSLPDPTATANLHITKEATPAGGQGNGTNDPGQDPGNPTISGVQFTIKQVNTIDLTTNAGWSAAGALSKTYNAAGATSVSAAEAAVTGAGYTLGTAQTQTTDANGQANFTGLPLGLYLVEETGTPAGVTGSAPFLVTLPMTNPDSTDAWMYDVYVYPKNAVTNAQKTVQDSSAVKLGDPVTWTVTADIPDSTGAGDTIDGYVIRDVLDSKLTYDPSNPATAKLSDGTTLTAGTDYNVTYDAATNKVEIVFTAAGRTTLAAHRDATVIATIPTTVNTVGDITNSAVLFPNQSAYDDNTGTPTNTVETKWGSITVEKTDPDGNPLTGAQFQVYMIPGDSSTTTEYDNPEATIAGLTPVSINGTDTWTTGADGTLTIDGLRYSGFANGASVNAGEDGYNQYYLVETKAPTGYELLADPVPFTIDATTSTVGVDLKVADVPHNGGFTLPFTGGTGALVLYTGGAALLAGAFVLAVGKRRKA